MPQVKISTQAAVLRPTPGSESRNSSDSSRGAVSVQSRSGWSPSRSRIAWIRGAFCLREAAGADRLLDLVDRRVADLLPGREALAQRGEGAVAVAVVGVLGEDGLDQLGDRVAVRLVDRLPVHLPQPVADRPHPPLVGSLPGSRARDPHRARPYGSRRWRRRSKRGSSVDGVRVFYRRVPGEGTPTVYCHGNPTHGEDWLPFMERGGPSIAIDMPGWGRSDRPDPARFDYSMYGLSAFLERCLDELGVGARKLVVHDWGALALIGAQRRPELVEKLVVDQRGAAAARLPLALGRPDLAPPAARRARSTRPTTRASMALLHAPGARRPQPDAARVRRHDLAALGQGHAGGRSSPSTATPTPTASPPPARTSAGSPARPWSSGATATPTCRPEFAEAYAARPAQRRARARPGRRPLALDRRPDGHRPRPRLPRLDAELFAPVNARITIGSGVARVLPRSAPAAQRLGRPRPPDRASWSASTSPTRPCAASPTASAPWRWPTASR